jgi:phospholipid/cholesterol/gamma-HCH transport system substrate-binding protein
MNKGLGGFGKHVITIALFCGVFLAWVGYILYQSGTLPTLGKKYTVTAVVPTAALLTPGARVTVAGAEVGRVKSIERADNVGPDAKLKLELTDDRVTPLPDDSRVQIRTRSQVGENYVSIAVGRSAQNIPDGGSLGLDNADELVSVDQILSVLQGKTRERTRTLLQQFGGALAGRGTDLNHTLAGVNDLAVHGGELVAALDENHDDTAKVVDHLGRLMSAVGDRGTAIDTIAARGYRAFRAIGDRDDQLEATLRELPSTLTAVRKASTTVGDVSDGSAPVVENLATTVRALEPAVRDFTPAAKAGVKLVKSLDAARSPVGKALTAVARVGYHLPRAYPELEKTLCQLNPMLRYANPYSKDILQILYGLGSSSNSYDATGHLIRLIPVVNEASLFGAPPSVLAAEKLLLQSGAFLPQKSISYESYMKPGQIGNSFASRDGKPANAKALRDSGYKFPHVTADC